MVKKNKIWEKRGYSVAANQKLVKLVLAGSFRVEPLAQWFYAVDACFYP